MHGRRNGYGQRDTIWGAAETRFTSYDPDERGLHFFSTSVRCLCDGKCYKMRDGLADWSVPANLRNNIYAVADKEIYEQFRLEKTQCHRTFRFTEWVRGEIA